MNDHTDPRALYDHATETSLLAACLYSKTARQEARKHITGADFYDPHHEELWDRCAALDRAGKRVDPVTMQATIDATTAEGRALSARLLEVTSADGFPDSAGEYAEILRGWATRRRLDSAARGLIQRVASPSIPANTLATEAVKVFTGVRDQGAHADVTALTLNELMEVEDVAPEWVIPGLLERGDRLMLTGSEGAGKSALSRQLGIMAAAGIHPFNDTIMPPIKAVFVDCENKAPQVRRQVRPLLDWLRRQGDGVTNPLDRVLMDFPGRINITRDRDLAAVHRLLDAVQPDLLVIGPVYRMVPRSLNDEEVAAEFLTAMDTIMDRGVTLIIEAHAGHSKDGENGRGARALRPRGSSSLLGWPEFGLGLRGLPNGIADLEAWRGGREQREWPTRLRRSPGNRWTETEPG